VIPPECPYNPNGSDRDECLISKDDFSTKPTFVSNMSRTVYNDKAKIHLNKEDPNDNYLLHALQGILTAFTLDKDHKYRPSSQRRGMNKAERLLPKLPFYNIGLDILRSSSMHGFYCTRTEIKCGRLSGGRDLTILILSS